MCQHRGRVNEYRSEPAVEWPPADCLEDKAAELMIERLQASLHLARMTAGEDADAIALVAECERLLDEIRADLAPAAQIKG